jgi:RHS repeat-associated protein
VVYGTFTSPQPANTIGSTRGGKDDNSKTVHDGGDGPAKCGPPGLPNYWVSTGSLNLAVQDTVCMYPGRGPQLGMTHSWNADPSKSGMFGKGWRFAYESGITKTASGATLRKGSGQELTYTGSTTTSPSVQTPPSGFYDTLTWMGTYWLMVAKDTKWTYRFDKAVISGQASETEYRLNSITDTNGNAVTLAYTAGNVIQTITDAVGRITTFTYDASNRVTRMDAPDGRYASYQYDGSGNLVQSVDLLGTVTTYTYDAGGYMTAMTVGDKTVTFTYTSVNSAMRVASVKDADGYATTYSMSGSTVTKTDPLGNATVYTGTSEGFTSGITDALSNSVKIEYTGGNPVTMTDALGKQTTKTYDARGNVTKITDAKGNSTTFTYDANDNLTGTTDALGKTWTYTYDAKNNLTKIASPLNNQTTMAYDASGQLTGVTNPAGKTATFSYTAHGNVATVTDPLGNQTKYEYDAKGINKTAVTDQKGNKTSFSYDANNRVTRVTNPDGTFKTYTYDCCSLTAVTDEKGNTATFNRDQVLNLTKVTDPLGSVTEMMYDGNANLTKVRDPLLRDTTNTYDKANRLVRGTDALSGSINYSYDANGHLTTLADERGKQTNITYDVNGRLATNIDPLNAVTQFARDELGRVASVTNARGKTVSSVYDQDGRATNTKYDGVTVATYGWNAASQLTSVTDSVGVKTLTRDAAGQVTAINYPDGLGLAITYDAAGNVSAISYPGSLVVSYSYDSRNRTSGVNFDANSVALNYDPTGGLSAETRSNGVQSTYGYDAAGRLVSLSHKKGTTVIADLSYTRNNADAVIGESGTLPLNPALTDSSVTGTYNNANAVLALGGDNYTYDADGNLTAITGARTFSAAYDNQNRPTSITLGGTARTYVYDGVGNRVKAQTATATRNFHHDPWGRLLFETNASGLVTANYIYAGSRLVASGTAAGGYVFYHQDKTGNTLALTNSSGAVVGAFAYSPDGAVLNQSGSVSTPFTYVGAYGVMSEGNDLYFMKNRYYDAGAGRFIQRDPIGFAGGQTNLYAYVGNNPVESIDPLGLFDQIFDDAPGAECQDQARLPMPLLGTDKELEIISGLSEQLSEKQLDFLFKAWGKANEANRREAARMFKAYLIKHPELRPTGVAPGIVLPQVFQINAEGMSRTRVISDLHKLGLIE